MVERKRPKNEIHAIWEGDIEKFDAFIEAGVDVHKVTEGDRWNFLHRAVDTLDSTPPDPAMIQHLVDYGIDMDAKDRYGNTPLHYAARARDPVTVGLLLDAGCEVDPVNNDGVTPLRQSILKKPVCLAATEALLAHGADVHHKHEDGASVIEFVRMVCHGDNNPGLQELFERYMT